MITRKDVMPVNYYKKEPFTGSFSGMRYMLRKKEAESEEEKTMLEAIVWPGPFCFEKTDDEKKESKCFPFDETGIEAAVEWLNSTYIRRFTGESVSKGGSDTQSAG